MESKNTIIAIILMLAVWVGFNTFFNDKPAPVEKAAETTEVSKEEKAAKPSKVVAEKYVKPATASVVAQREIVVDTDSYRAVFTNSGARLKTFELKGYRESQEADSQVVNLVRGPSGNYPTLNTLGLGGVNIAEDALYEVSLSNAEVRIDAGQTRDIVFTHQSPEGLVLEKRYTFSGDDYQFDLKVRLINTGSAPVNSGVSVGLVRYWDDSMKTDRTTFSGPATLIGEEVQEDSISDIEEDPVHYGDDVIWTGFEDKYFLAAIVPIEGSGEKVVINHPVDTVNNIVKSPLRLIGPGQSTSFDYLIFFGPRDTEILNKVGHGLEFGFDFGFFSILARPLLDVLNFFYSYVGNYGVAIIILTVIIKILFWPLTQKSHTSMKAMKHIQPEMNRIRQKYKNDKARLNQELMKLYQENRVNPLGGCMPMFIQIPVFFALYKVLLGNIALRHAPFGLWITDLSAKDPYYITPIIMGLTMLIQQRLTPTAMEPAQAKMMMAMPVVFTFMFLNFPAGLVIYWLINNLLTILQQILINRKDAATEAEA